ncbi:hypothetical protein ACFFX0_29970 [Citricoccus parietis]|uniref:Nicotinate phosphoribosyltransferase C-terminal domain-containing protein n=1 Tax=Citricoccus parietis TaxID=592307 RepID=A0ABV5G892_9MICC
MVGADIVAFDEEINFPKMIHPFDPLQQLQLHPYQFKPILHMVMENGKVLTGIHDLLTSAKYCQEQLAKLPDEYKRFENPHIYKVGISEALHQKELRSNQVLKTKRFLFLLIDD